MYMALSVRSASNFRESRDSCHFIDFLIFCLKDPYGELVSNITFKSSADFLFWRNREKLKIPSDARRRPLETGINCAFSTCSCIKTEKCLESPLLCVVVHHFLLSLQPKTLSKFIYLGTCLTL